MRSFDTKTKTLVLSKLPLEPIIDSYTESDQYRSYKKYLTKGLEEDVKTVLIPALNKLLKDKDIEFDSHSNMLNIVKEEDYLKHVKNTTKLSLLQKNYITTFEREDKSIGFTIDNKALNAFNLLEIPYMDFSGIIYNNGKLFSIANTLTLDDTITFDGDKLSITDNFHKLVFDGTSKPKLNMFDTSVSMIDFTTMLAKLNYGYEEGSKYSKNFILSLRDSNVLSAISGNEEDNKMFGSDTLSILIDSLIGALNDQKMIEFDFEDKYTNEYFSTLNTRDELNELLSFNNIKGRILSKDVVSASGEILASKNAMITDYLISKFNSNFIDTVYIRKSLDLIGMYTAEIMFFGNKIIKGTPIIKEMIDLIPELKGYSIAPMSYDIPDFGLIVNKNVTITQELCDFLDYVSIDSIKYKEKIKSNKTLIGYLEEEYINNRHFLTVDINNNDSIETDRYTYVDIYNDYYPPQPNLTCHDVAALTSLFIKLKRGNHLDLVSDPDAGLRKRVEQCADHFHKAFRYATKSLIKKGYSSLKRLSINKDDFNNVDKVNRAFRFFSSDFFRCLRLELKVIEPLNCVNPVATLSAITRINTIVADSDAISDSMRRLQLPYYGRICPYETPQSKKLGIINNIATGCSVEDGVLYASYYKVYNEGGVLKVGTTPIKLTAFDEENYRIADISALDLDYDTRVIRNTGKVLARVPSMNSLEKTTISSIDVKFIQYVNTSPNQHASYACTTIPHAGSDDAARVQFGLSMVKQAKGLIEGEIPIVCTTGFTNIVNKNTFYKIFAEHNGRVDIVNSNMIVVSYDGISEPASYSFEQMSISPESIVLRVSEVIVGDRVIKGQTLVSSNFIKDNTMVIGTNAIVAFMTDGSNYEDGQSSSERISVKLTSYGVHTDKFSIPKSTPRAVAEDVKYNKYLGKGDKMFTKKGKLSKSSEYSSTYMHSSKCRGYIAGVEYIRDGNMSNITKEIEVRSVSFDRLDESDKLCNRHGNKGVSCKISKNSEMPYFENGEFIDIKYNPLGIPSRMNVGQVLEASVGLVGYVLGIRIMCDSFDSMSKEDINLLLSYTVDLSNSADGSEDSICSKYPTLPADLHKHCINNISKIRYWKGTFNKEGKAYLTDPVSGKRTLSRVNIGVNYVYKLVQEGEDKLHSRAGALTSRYVFKTESPTRGASEGGGQTFGYMEEDALTSYGCEELLREMTNERSDNYVARNNVTVEALHSGDPTYMLDESKGLRRSTEWMMQLFKALGYNGTFTDKEIDWDSVDGRKYYKREELFKATFDGDEQEEDIVDIMVTAFKKLKEKQ